METGLTDDILDLLRCPITGQQLRAISPEALGECAADFSEGAFLTEDGSRAYPVRGGFPVLIESEALLLRG